MNMNMDMNSNYQLVPTTMYFVTFLSIMLSGSVMVEHFGYTAINVLLFGFVTTTVVVIFIFMEKMLRYLKSISDGLEKINGTVDKVTNVFVTNTNNNLKIGLYSTFTKFMLKLCKMTINFVSKPKPKYTQMFYGSAPAPANMDRNIINSCRGFINDFVVDNNIHVNTDPTPSPSPASVPSPSSSSDNIPSCGDSTSDKYTKLVKEIINSPNFKENVKQFTENPMLLKQMIENPILLKQIIEKNKLFDDYPLVNIVLNAYAYVDALQRNKGDIRDPVPTGLESSVST